MATKKNSPVTKATNAASKAEELESIVWVNHADLDMSYPNARSGGWHTNSGDETQNQLTELATSMRDHGQLSPILCRPNKHGKPQLICGNRRAAAALLNANGNRKQARLKAIVKPMSDLEARFANTLENTSRDDLPLPDLAFALYEIENLSKASGANLNDTIIGARVGISQGHANALLNIMRNLHNAGNAKLAQEWRDSKVEVGKVKMLAISKKPSAAEQAAAFKEEISKVPGTGSDGTKGPKGWIATASKEAGAIAGLLGQLTREKRIKVLDALDWKADIRVLVSFKSEAAGPEITTIAKAAKTAYLAELNGPTWAEQEAAAAKEAAELEAAKEQAKADKLAEREAVKEAKAAAKEAEREALRDARANAKKAKANASAAPN